MSIYNVNPDPDYPVTNTMGFIQHTTQPMQAYSESYYYNGQTFAPTMPYQQQYNVNPMDSRRYDAPVPQQVMAAPQPQVTYGFNQLVESRRNDAPPVQNPWAVQPTAQAPMQPAPIPQAQGYYQPVYDPNYNAAYAQQHPSFDPKQGVWDNPGVYTTVTMPTVNWGAQPGPVPANVPQYGYMESAPMIQYPPVQQPVALNWAERAESIWGK